MGATVLGSHGSGIHASRPAGNTVPDGSLYSCSTHSLIYVSSYAGNSWATWASLTGTGLTDPMTTRGDMLYRDASNVTARLALPAAGQVIGRSGSDLGAIYPPGYELDYVEFTAPVSITGTTEAGAQTVVTGTSRAFDGTAVWVEFFAPRVVAASSASAAVILFLLEDATVLGFVGLHRTPSADGANYDTVDGRRKVTPSAGTHQYSVKAFRSGANGSVEAGAGGTGADVPGYIRITKA